MRTKESAKMVGGSIVVYVVMAACSAASGPDGTAANVGEQADGSRSTDSSGGSALVDGSSGGSAGTSSSESTTMPICCTNDSRPFLRRVHRQQQRQHQLLHRHAHCDRPLLLLPSLNCGSLLHGGSFAPGGSVSLAGPILRPARSRRYFTISTNSGASPADTRIPSR
jgi:hypothetical protein